jgi:AAA15 family ATPase/GTPase
MIATREKNHGRRLTKIVKHKMRLLPVAAIYGGNASGKTGLIEAMSFAQMIILRSEKSDRPIPAEPFLLNSESKESPSRFSFTFLADDRLFEYEFSCTLRTIIYEQLTEFLGARKRVFFVRNNDKVIIDTTLPDAERLQFAFLGTNQNQLFLNNAVSQKIATFDVAYDWFEALHIIGPHSHFGPCRHFFSSDHGFAEQVNDMLRQLDTGITGLGSRRVSPEDVGMSEVFRKRMERDLREGESRSIYRPLDQAPLIASREDGQLCLFKQVSHHLADDGSIAAFDLDDESEGSRRLIDLLPPFLDLVDPETPTVLIIDEIDRSLHTLLLRRLLEWYLESRASESRTQLVFTTHDVLLMDQVLFRRDEMWVTEREIDGSSKLFALSDYEGIRYDKDIRKSYLQGRLGGIPRILLSAESRFNE